MSFLRRIHALFSVDRKAVVVVVVVKGDSWCRSWVEDLRSLLSNEMEKEPSSEVGIETEESFASMVKNKAKLKIPKLSTSACDFT